MLGGSRQAEAGLARLASQGYDLVVCDRDPDAPGFAHANHRILASVYHPGECLPAVEAFHAEYPIDGVMCIACDVPHVVARIANQLKLPGNSLEAADRCVDKLAMKDALSNAGIAIPRYQAVDQARDIHSLLDTWGQLILKPVDSRGSKGVSRVTEAGQIALAFKAACAASPTNRVMVEEFLSGPQISSEGLVIDGQIATPALSDRSYPHMDRYAPYIVEDGGDMPTRQPAQIIAAIDQMLAKAAQALGLITSPLKGDIVIHKGVPHVIELAARLSGGYFCTHQIPFSTGVYLVDANAKIALGSATTATNWLAIEHRPVSTRWLIPGAGTIQSFSDEASVCRASGVLAFDHWAERGKIVGAPQDASASVAMVQATGKNQDEAAARAYAALDKFELKLS